MPVCFCPCTIDSHLKMCVPGPRSVAAPGARCKASVLAGSSMSYQAAHGREDVLMHLLSLSESLLPKRGDHWRSRREAVCFQPPPKVVMVMEMQDTPLVHGNNSATTWQKWIPLSRRCVCPYWYGMKQNKKRKRSERRVRCCCKPRP